MPDTYRGIPIEIILGLYWCYIGIMENLIQTTIWDSGFRVCRGVPS